MGNSVLPLISAVQYDMREKIPMVSGKTILAASQSFPTVLLSSNRPILHKPAQSAFYQLRL